jgi:outer membrane protein W
VRKLIALSLVTFLCLPLAVYAASIGGAETQGQGKFGIGLDQEFVFDRDLKFDKASWGGLGPGETLKIEIDRMYRTMVKASYGVLDNLDVYAKLGTADFKMTGVFTAPGEEWHHVEKGRNAFAYGVGAKGTYNLNDNWLIGIDLQYLGHKNKYKASGYNALNPAQTESWEGKATFREWQVAPYIAKKIGNFVPYLGVKYSDLRIKDKTEDGWMKLKADDNVGVFLGTDYKLAENWKLNLEGRFVDETAMSLAATYKF